MMKQKPLKTQISITIDEPIYKRIKELAEIDDRGVSSYINLVLRKYLSELYKTHQYTAPGGPGDFYFNFCHSPTANSSQRLL